MSNDNIYNIEIAGFGNIAYQINGNEIKLCDASDKKYDNVNKIKLAKLREEQGVNIINDNDDFISDVNENTIDQSFGPGELS